MDRMLVDNSVLEGELGVEQTFSDAIVDEALLLTKEHKLQEGDWILDCWTKRTGKISEVHGSEVSVYFLDNPVDEVSKVPSDTLCKLKVAVALKEEVIATTHSTLKSCDSIIRQNGSEILDHIAYEGGKARVIAEAPGDCRLEVSQVLHAKALAYAAGRGFPTLTEQWKYAVEHNGVPGHVDEKTFREQPPVYVARESERVLFVGTGSEAKEYVSSSDEILTIVCVTGRFWPMFFGCEDFVSSKNVSVPEKIVFSGKIGYYNDSAYNILQGDDIVAHLTEVACKWGSKVSMFK